MTSFRIGMAQIPQTGDMHENLSTALEYIGRASQAGVDLLCFPETHLPGYRVGVLDPDAPVDELALERALDAVREHAREHRIGVVVGTETPNPGGKPYNSAAVVGRRGELIGVHHKSRLTPHDELAYEGGGGPTEFEFDGIPMGLVICFEGFRFPEASRELAKNGAKVIIHPQFNHVLPGAEWKLPVHEALIVARAAENTAFFVSANMAHPRNNSRSLVVGPDGLVIAASELGRSMLVTAEIDPAKATHAILKGDPAELMRVLAETGSA